LVVGLWVIFFLVDDTDTYDHYDDDDDLMDLF